MRTTFISRLSVVSITAATILTALVSARAQTASLKIAPLKYRQRVLPNGLTVLSIENHQSPTVAIQVWYHVGAKDDPEGRSGFAHLFEHIMFKATKNQHAENMDRLTEDIGGENNAFTEDDHTVYHETVPSNYLETLLWAEADRMANLSVDQANFLSERAVVEEEYRQSIMARPYGRLELFIDGHSFTVHPYKRGVIGSIENLDAATLDDVIKFHNTYYRPDNATLIVSGDFDPAQLDAWVDKYFGRIPKPAGEVPRVTAVEPPRTAEARFNTTGPNVPLPATAITYLIPPRKSDDTDTLRIIETILSRGEASRLNQSLVYKQEIASEANANADVRDDAGLFTVQVTTAGGKSADAAEKAALAELDKLKTEPVTAAELDKARNQLLASALDSRETAQGQAFALGDAAVNYGDPDRVNTDIEKLQAVTPADIQRVAQKYFTAENRVVIRYENGKEEQGGKSSAPKPLPPAAEAVFTPEEKPPAPAAPRTVIFPTPVEKNLSNGVRVIVIAKPGTGLISLLASVDAGSVFEQNQTAGLAEFTASLLTRGTKTRTAPQIAEGVEGLGGSVSAGASLDGATVSLSSLANQLDQALPIFAEVVLAPAFAHDEIERLRSEKLDDLTVSLRNPRPLAMLTAARVVFGDGGYGHSPGGTPETIRTLDAAQINTFYQAHFQPRRMTLVFGGDITPETAFAAAEKYFGDWKGSDIEAAPAPPETPAQKNGRVIVIDKTDAGQAAVVIARTSIRRADRDYELGRVANGILGEGYSARLNEEIRIKRGLSYGAGSGLSAHKDAGIFIAQAQTRNDAAAQVAVLMRDELARLAKEPVGADELVPRKAAISGNYAHGLETGGGLASSVASLAIYGLPLNLNEFLPRIQAATAPEIKKFAAKRLSVAGANIIIVGDCRQFLSDLKKDFKNVEVIPVDKLDLNSARLVKP